MIGLTPKRPERRHAEPLPPHVTEVRGRHFLNDRAAGGGPGTLTLANREAMRTATREELELRRAVADLNLARAVQLGAALRALDGGTDEP